MTIVIGLFFIQTSAVGFDITDKFSLGGILVGAYQYQWEDGAHDFDYTQVAEVYWRLVLNDYFAITVDAQYMQDKYNTG